MTRAARHLRGLAAVLLAAGCSSERIDPVTRIAFGEPPPDAGIGGGPTDAGPAPPARRTVATRNPFGGPATNLLVDGDFELSMVPDGNDGQYGWIAFTNSASATMKGETGGLCFSGIRCASLDKDTYLFGRGAAAFDAPLALTIHVKVPAAAACTDVHTYAVSCDTFATLKKLAADNAPAPDGWCAQEAKLGVQQAGVCLYVDPSALPSGARALVDAAVVARDDGTARRAGETWIADERDRYRLGIIRDHLRRRFDRPTPAGGVPSP